ncbi:hypothetical protein LCI18_013933 [Fusarium solani-melongenae]|uniref:Uncharacterized protein n=1 Tax=Fusarium solani subsp. cucurbitae TaxID=2747967 RepID=A0ACD3ZNU6_FUSSC|nr:hypothetical protein LCI18_013933 [Fusarium solani-melongenae]
MSKAHKAESPIGLRIVLKSRRRSPKACVTCRTRKVRCDVSYQGNPCTNCRLDGEKCLVTHRASHRQQKPGEATNTPTISTLGTKPYDNEVVDELAATNDDEAPASPSKDGESLLIDLSQLEAANIESTVNPEEDTKGSTNHSLHEPVAPISLESNSEDVNDVPLSLPDEMAPFFSTETPLSWLDYAVSPNVTATYSYHSFLVINNLSCIMPQDLNYLESQGCLEVPTNEVLDDFIQQYFLHVHPLLPLINEGDFWDAFYLRDAHDRVPLLVLQAMLFSSCPFVSQESLEAFGFPDTRTARAILYRRARLMYCFETEFQPIYLAQAALLLSFWSPNPSEPQSLASTTKKANTRWLGVAIQQAKAAGAHIQASPLPHPPSVQLVGDKDRNLLRRLWWCCIIRDRTLALGLRRSLQVSRLHFDFDQAIPLGFADLMDEVERSMVYDAKTKWYLMELFVQFVELCSVLTDVITLLYPLDDMPNWSRHCPDQVFQLSECKRALKQWYMGATTRFTGFSGDTHPESNGRRVENLVHNAIILYSNFIRMLYHSTRAAICHHEALQAALENLLPRTNGKASESIQARVKELREAAFETTKCFQGLADLGLDRWLPITAVPYLALPLMLHVLDSKLSPSPINTHNDKSTEFEAQALAHQHRLNTLIKVMKASRPQYDGVDFVAEVIRHVIDLVKVSKVPDDGPSGQSDDRFSFTGWTDMFTLAPRLYLRLVVSLDIGFSNARLPLDADLPCSLRGT